MSKVRKKPEQAISVACSDELVLVALTGSGSMNNSHVIHKFVKHMAVNGMSEVCMDMQQCTGMDSTFMGTLVLMKEELGRCGGRLFLVNLNEANHDKLEELGVVKLLDIAGNMQLPEVGFKKLEVNDSLENRMKLVLQAHESLIQANEGNREKFEVFVRELRRHFEKP